MIWTSPSETDTADAQCSHADGRLQAFLDLFWIADSTLEAAEHNGDIRATLEASGKSIGPLDLLIAAQARSLGATLVTASAGEFKRVKGLKVQTWKERRQ